LTGIRDRSPVFEALQESAKDTVGRLTALDTSLVERLGQPPEIETMTLLPDPQVTALHGVQDGIESVERRLTRSQRENVALLKEQAKLLETYITTFKVASESDRDFARLALKVAVGGVIAQIVVTILVAVLLRSP
jgi:hypothetical protein